MIEPGEVYDTESKGTVVILSEGPNYYQALRLEDKGEILELPPSQIKRLRSKGLWEQNGWDYSYLSHKELVSLLEKKLEIERLKAKRIRVLLAEQLASNPSKGKPWPEIKERLESSINEMDLLTQQCQVICDEITSRSDDE